MALHLGVAELALGLALELRLQHLDADHRGQPFAHVLTAEVWVLLLEDPGLARVAVQHVGQGGAKTRQVGAALDRVDRVGECDHVLDEGLVVLQRDLDLRALDLAVDVKRRHVDHRRVAVQRAHEGNHAAFEVEGGREAEGLVGERNLEALVQVRHLAQAMQDDLAVELRVREDLRVGPEADDGAGAVGLADRLDRRLGHAPLVLLLVDLAAAVDPDLEPLAQEVDGRDAYAVKSRRDLVATAAELAPRVQAGHHELEGGQTLFLVDVDRDTSAIVVDLDAAVGEEGDDDLPGVAGQGLVDRVVDHLVDQVVEARRAGRTDVHARPPPNMLPAFEDLDLLGGIRHIRA